LEGTITIDALVEFAVKHKSPYAVLTDTNSMAGLIQFADKASTNNIKPILGCYIDNPNNIKEYVLLLAKNNSGYSEICKIITERKLNEKFSLGEIVKNISGNLFIVTPSLELIKKTYRVLNSKNLFAELLIANGKKKVTRKLYEFAKRNGIKYIASNPAYFEKKEDYNLHKAVRAIKFNSTFENIGKEYLAEEDYYLRTPGEIKNIWKKLPEALRNISYIVNNCNVNLKLNEYKFPHYKLPQNEDAFTMLWNICFNGLEKRYGFATQKTKERLEYELSVIEQLNFTDYFLIVRDIVKEAKRRGMITLGRGSAANSLVSYCLEFTEVDPVKHNLYFERFLNKGRKSPPDVDLDFSWKERDEIIKYIFDKYGYGNVAMISTTVTFRARSAFREVAKIFGVSQNEISKFSKFIPWTSAKNLQILSEKFPEAKSLNFNEEPWKSIVKIASKLAGFPRHLSIHPGGIIITEKPITNYVALEYAKNKGLGLIVTQPDMYSTEKMGLIKIDILSQRSLGVLRDTTEVISKGRNI
jgi:DNA polymerase III alpha subunit